MVWIRSLIAIAAEAGRAVEPIRTTIAIRPWLHRSG